jgi:hypothetical protein
VPVRRAAAIVAGVALLAAPAGARQAPAPKATAAPAAAPTKVAVVPLASLGDERSGAELRRLEKVLVAGLAGVAGVQVIDAAAVGAAIRKSGRSELKGCDGAPACLAAIGGLVGAAQVVYGEAGGLGDAGVIYLKVVDAATGREHGSTTLELGATGRERAAVAAATRLLAPARYVGTLDVQVSVAGATIYLDGERIGRAPARPRATAVGEHALRVTHPEHRDFVRFVDVPFGETVRLQVDLAAYAIVDRELARTARSRPVGPPPPAEPAPWYGRWYTIAGAGAVLLVGSALVVGALVDGIEADRTRDVD